jgi:hypothetical protein
MEKPTSNAEPAKPRPDSTSSAYSAVSIAEEMVSGGSRTSQGDVCCPHQQDSPLMAVLIVYAEPYQEEHHGGRVSGSPVLR